MGAPDDQHVQPPRYDEADMFARLEQQVSFNYNIIQCQRQKFQHINETVGRLQLDMEGVVIFMKHARDDLRLGRVLPRAMDQGLYDPADVKVLANQTANVKVNWVDKLETELQFTEQRLKRLETQIAINAPGPLLVGAASRAEQQHYEAMRAQQKLQAPNHPVPTMRPGAALSSEHGHPPAPVLESQPTPDFHPGQERHLSASEQVQQASCQPGFRAVELQPPPAAALYGWRPAESYPPSGRPPPPSCNDPLQSHPPGSESQAGGWAAVNLSQASKRPRDEHQPQHDSDQHESLKRPKLATLPPLKPRPSFDDDHHQCPYVQQAQMNSTRQVRGRVPSGENPIRPHSHPAPGQGATNSHRFITSTGQPDNQEYWRATNGDPAIGALFEHSTTGATGCGRERGNRGERHGGRGRGGKGSSGPTNNPPPASEAPTQEHVYKQVLSEWREHQLAATQQGTTNRHYLRQPIRNSDGVLMRKDGRPDMRSVSSTNNLRKLYEKDAAAEKDSSQLELSAKRVASKPLPGKVAS